MVGGDWEDTIYFAIITIHCLFLVTSSLVLLSYLVKSIDYVRVLRNPRPIGKAYFGNRQTNERSLYRCLFDKVSFMWVELLTIVHIRRIRNWLVDNKSFNQDKSIILLFRVCRLWRPRTPRYSDHSWNSYFSQTVEVIFLSCKKI